MKPIDLICLDHASPPDQEDDPSTPAELRARLQRRRPSLSLGMSLQPDTPDAMLRWLQASMG